jgi:hypothetical protein
VLFRSGALALAAAWRGLLITITLVKAGFIGVNSASLITAVRMGALAFGGALQALGASFMALASRVFPAVIAGFRALKVAMMTNPVGAIVGGIAIAATLVVTNWESVKSFFMTIWEPIKPVWEAFGDWLGKFWEKIKTPFKAVGGLWDKMWGKKDAPELSIPEMQPVGDALLHVELLLIREHLLLIVDDDLAQVAHTTGCVLARDAAGTH